MEEYDDFHDKGDNVPQSFYEVEWQYNPHTMLIADIVPTDESFDHSFGTHSDFGYDVRNLKIEEHGVVITDKISKQQIKMLEAQFLFYAIKKLGL